MGRNFEVLLLRRPTGWLIRGQEGMIHSYGDIMRCLLKGRKKIPEGHRGTLGSKP